jgi:hypothetical protein
MAIFHNSTDEANGEPTPAVAAGLFHSPMLALGIDSRLQIPDSKSGCFRPLFWNLESGIRNSGPNSTAKAENETALAVAVGPAGEPERDPARFVLEEGSKPGMKEIRRNRNQSAAR